MNKTTNYMPLGQTLMSTFLWIITILLNCFLWSKIRWANKESSQTKSFPFFVSFPDICLMMLDKNSYSEIEAPPEQSTNQFPPEETNNLYVLRPPGPDPKNHTSSTNPSLFDPWQLLGFSSYSLHMAKPRCQLWGKSVGWMLGVLGTPINCCGFAGVF